MRIVRTVFRSHGRIAGKRTARKLSAALSLASLAMALSATAELAAQTDWPMFGQNAANTASSSAETTISTKNVSKLRLKWKFQTGGDVSARAAVVNNVAYFPDWGGNLWAVNALNGKLIWGNQFSNYGLTNPTYARSTPAVVNGVLYIGVQQGAWMLAINAATGQLIWKTQLESVDPLAIITTSPTIVNGVVYEGVASTQEALFGGAGPARGSVVALNAANGTVLWKTYTTPQGYTGAGVWGSNPVVDAARSTVYVGTGDNYSTPTDPVYVACVNAAVPVSRQLCRFHSCAGHEHRRDQVGTTNGDVEPAGSQQRQRFLQSLLPVRRSGMPVSRRTGF